MNKRAVPTATLIILAAIGGFASAQQIKASGPSRPPLIDNEAKTFAQRVWNKVLRRCPDPPRGDSYFTYSLSGVLHFVEDKLYWASQDGAEPLAGYCCQTMTEIKNLSFQMIVRPVSEADRLNGVTWVGESYMLPKAHRQREQRNEVTDRAPLAWGPWSEWKQGPPTFGAVRVIYIKRIHGAWQFGQIPVEQLAGMPGCSDLEAPISEKLWPTHNITLDNRFYRE